MRRWSRGMCTGVLAALLIALAAEAGARELYRQNLAPKNKPTPGQTAQSTDSVRVSFKGVRRGLISFDLQRLPTSRSERAGGVPVRFRDADGGLVFLTRVLFQSQQDPSRAAIHLVGPEFSRKGLGLWSPLILLDEAIEPGQTVHVDLAWDDDTEEYGLFVDGQAVESRPGTYDPATGDFVRDAREKANEAARRRGEPSLFPSEPLGHFLSQVRTIEVGAPPDSGGRRRGPRKHETVDESVARNAVVAVDESLTDLHPKKHDVKGLEATWTDGQVVLSWLPPDIHGIDQQYAVYRREGAGGRGRFEKLTDTPVRELRYADLTARPGQTYRYSVTSIYGDLKGGSLESKYPPEVTVDAADRSIRSVAAEKNTYGVGQEIAVTVRGTPDMKATFSIAGVAEDVAMEEVDDGVYVGKVMVPPGNSITNTALTAQLNNPTTGETLTAAGEPLTIDGTPPEAIPPGRILAEAIWPGEIEVSWLPSASADVDHYAVYRATGGDEPQSLEAAFETTRGTKFIDTRVIAGLEYRYAVAPVDRAGNQGPVTATVAATAVAGAGPKISSVVLDPLGRPAKPGQTVTITVVGQADTQVTADFGELTKGIALTEQGRTGRYVGHYAVRDADVGPAKSTHRVVIHMADPFGTSTHGGPELVIVGRDTLNDVTPPVIASASHDGFHVAGFSGKLVADDVLTVTLEGEPGGYATFDIPGVVWNVPATEASPGVYRGSYRVGWDADGTEVPVVARLADEAGNETTMPSGRPVSFDTRVRIQVTARDSLLPADRKSTTKLFAQATNANGDEVPGHELMLTLSTTEEYTGVVGGGRIEDQEARLEDEDDVDIKWGGITDAFGEIAATYTAGFAAKTALIVAKDLTTGDVGAGWLNTYIAATVVIELTPRSARGATDRANLTLTADPTKLTADGRSTSRLRARLTDLSGQPLSGERVVFALGSENGRIRILDSVTDRVGIAEAEYRAGTAIGTVTVTASAARYGVTASVQITLMSDAPAKIELVADARKLPADGRSEAALSVTVTDIHDNPNQQVPVTFAVLSGEGGFTEPVLLTDRNGEVSNTFIAGRAPGPVVIEARHTSRAPTEDELRRVYGTVFMPRLIERQERDRIKIVEWLAAPGDEVEKGQDLVTVEGGKGRWTLASPVKGTFVREVRHRRDRVALGETLGYVEIDPEAWEAYGSP